MAETSALPAPRQLVLHTVVTMLAAMSLTVLLHESSHTVTSILLGHPARQYAFASDAGAGLQGAELAVVALAGPLFSLVTGVVILAVGLTRPVVRQGVYFTVWLGATSFLEGAGYLVLSPFGIGDTGTVAAMYGVQNSLGWVAFVLGIGATALMAWLYGRWIASLVPYDDAHRLGAMSWIPWIFGTVVFCGLSVLWLSVASITMDPGSVIAVVMGSFALSVWAPMAMPFTSTLPADRCDSRAFDLGFPVLSAVVFVVCLVVNVVLGQGPSFG